MLPIAYEGTAEFDALCARLEQRGPTDLAAVESAVRGTLAEVRRGGDEALLALVARFESRTPAVLFRRDYDGAGALARLPENVRNALSLAADRIARYHEHQVIESFRYEEDGVRLGMRVR